jgi:predicted nicotinamide N-methyase
VASGSGLVAIAAAKAGAQSVLAGDIDENALAAIALNAAANAASAVTPLTLDLAADPGAGGPPSPGGAVPHVVLAADVCYQRELAAVALRFLQAARQAGADVLLADPGRAFVPRESLTAVAVYQVPVLAVLEDAPVKQVTIYRLG